MSDQQEKQRILDIAADKFMAQGLSKVTLDEVAGDLGMSKKTVYKFFPSKDDLLRAIVHMIMGRMKRRIEEIVTSDRPSEEKLTEFLVMLGSFLRKASGDFIADVQRFAPSLWKEMETFRREQMLPRVNEMFVQARKEGIFRQDLNIELFYLVFITVVQGIINPKVLSENSFSAQEAFRGIFKLLFEGALTGEAKTKLHLFEQTNFEQS
ncbi:MAG: TetR/AcrR family transcriptional regulator [Bacteroidota bacterium]